MKIIILTTSILLIAATINAQENKHQFSLYVAPAVSSLQYKLSAGDCKSGIGGNIGAGYQYALSSLWSINTGIELSRYQSKTSAKAISDSYMASYKTDIFKFSYTSNDYHETQTAMFVNIPLMMRYEKNNFFIAMGGKLGIPLKASYKHGSTAINTSAYYEQYQVTLDAPSFMGFGAFDGVEGKGNLKLNMAYIGSLETGIKKHIAAGKELYIGVYVDYGLNNVNKKTPPEYLLKYNSSAPDKFIHNSVLVSQHTDNGNRVIFTDKVKPVAIGVKLRLAIAPK